MSEQIIIYRHTLHLGSKYCRRKTDNFEVLVGRQINLNCNHLLTAYSRVLLEKLTISQLVK